MNNQKSNSEGSLFRAILLVICACLIYGIMQGTHDNYGIMMKALVTVAAITPMIEERRAGMFLRSYSGQRRNWRCLDVSISLGPYYLERHSFFYGKFWSVI